MIQLSQRLLRKSKKSFPWRGKITPSITKTRASARQDVALAIRNFRCRSNGSKPAKHPTGGAPSKKSQVQFAHSRHQRFHPERPNLSGGNVKNLSPGEDGRKNYLRGQGFRGRLSRPESACVGIWSNHLSL